MINMFALCSMYLIPYSKYLFTALKGEETFRKLNLSHSYQKFQLDDEKELPVINTYALYQTTCFQFCVFSASNIIST